MSLTPLVALLLVAQWLSAARAQTCPPPFDWAKNSRGQDPCSVAAQVREACSQQLGTPLADSLDPPKQSSQNSCTCSYTYYTLVSGCLDCQRRNLHTLTDWRRDCVESPVSGFGPSVYIDPNVIVIPSWALEGRSVLADVYVPAEAQRLAEIAAQPDTASSTASATPSTTNTSSLSMTASSTGTSSATSTVMASSTIRTQQTTLIASITIKSHSSSVLTNPTSDIGLPAPVSETNVIDNGKTADGGSPGSEKKVKNVGPIVGGVIGGLIALLGLSALIFFILRRRRKVRIAPSAAYLAQFGDTHPRMTTPRPFSPLPAIPLPLASRSDVPLPPSNIQDPLIDNHNTDVRETTLSRASIRINSYTRTTSPLLGPRPRE